MNNNFYDNSIDKSKTITSTTTIAMIKAYMWMFVGTLLTFVFGLFFTKILNDVILNSNGHGMNFFLFGSIVSFVVLLILTFSINKNALVKLNYTKALIGFLSFALISGFSFSSIFIFFDIDVLLNVFAGVTLYFLLLTLFTFIFRKKIHKAAGFAYVGLSALLVTSLLISLYSLLFYNPTSLISPTLYLTISIVGVLIFSIITMVDVKAMYNLIEYSEHKKCASISAAFTLYLDFINIFIYVLRILMILGKNTRNND